MRKTRILLVLFLAASAPPCFAAEPRMPGASADAIPAQRLDRDAGKDAKSCFTGKTADGGTEGVIPSGAPTATGRRRRAASGECTAIHQRNGVSE